MLRLFALILMLLLANTHGLRQRDKSPFRAKLSPQRLLDKWSRNLCGTLRHKALKQGLPMGSDGFVRVSDILRHPAYSRLSWDMLQKVVGTDSKRRFQLTPIAPSFDGMEATKGDMYAWHIRACQGHSVRYAMACLCLCALFVPLSPHSALWLLPMRPVQIEPFPRWRMSDEAR